jgi:hypothetical protein
VGSGCVLVQQWFVSQRVQQGTFLRTLGVVTFQQIALEAEHQSTSFTSSGHEMLVSACVLRCLPATKAKPVPLGRIS